MALTQSSQWQRLLDHVQAVKDQSMQDYFRHKPGRAVDYSIEACGLYLDYSKNRVNEETLRRLVSLAQATEVESWRDKMFAGEKINHTENRAVLHTALRRPTDTALLLDGHNIAADIESAHKKMRSFCHAVHSGEWCGWTGKRFTTVVNIGIGGSHLGPLMAIRALQPYADKGIDCRFISNVDGYPVKRILAECHAEETLVIISSKSFTTSETQQNAEAARAWFLQQGASEADIAQHFVAVSSNIKQAKAFGIAQDNIFPMWDWVGGRYSLCSAIGLPLALSIGMDGFMQMLEGAQQMDQHFQQAPLPMNMPVIMALLGIWYINFFNASSHAILPYDERLSQLPGYLQQLDMESNGKQIDRSGCEVDYQTGPVIWGTTGTNGQHAYFQLLHQGGHLIPVDFIVARSHPYSIAGQHRSLLANCIAQSEALMMGKSQDEAAQELKSRYQDYERLAPYYTFKGNHPSNTIMLNRLDPATLGALIALYEHKVFVQGIIWNINSFDQWGVEYGKRLAAHIEARLMDPESKLVPTHSDQSNISASADALILRVNSAPKNG